MIKINRLVIRCCMKNDQNFTKEIKQAFLSLWDDAYNSPFSLYMDNVCGTIINQSLMGSLV